MKKSLQKKTKVSIILPTFNGSKTIARSISSVINQSTKEWELIIIDDGSTDTTSEIAYEYTQKDSRIKLYKNETNLGIQKTLNRGLALSSGKFVARIDDDDLWVDENKLFHQIKILDENPDIVLVGSGVIVVDPSGEEKFRYLPPQFDDQIRAKILQQNQFTHSCVMFRNNLAQAIGGYSESESTKHVEDYDLWLRIGIFGKFFNIPEYFVQYQDGPSNISSRNKIEQFRKDILLIKKYKKNYPKYFRALFKGYLRLVTYGIYEKFLTHGVKRIIFKFYKCH